MDLNLYISALQRQPCLLKTNSTRVLVTWLVTLLLIICPSSYKARLNNLIGTADIEPQIISPQWSNARPNFPTKTFVGGAKFCLVSRLHTPMIFNILYPKNSLDVLCQRGVVKFEGLFVVRVCNQCKVTQQRCFIS